MISAGRDLASRTCRLGTVLQSCLLLGATACGGSQVPAGDSGDGSEGGVASDDPSSAADEGSNQSSKADEGDEGSASEQSSTPSGDGDGDDDSNSAGDEGPTLKFDLGTIPETPPAETGCGKVDFLFVIDNSGSMADEQVNLKTSFPGFIEAIEVTLGVEDFHVMTVATGGPSGGSSTSSCTGRVCTCTPAPSCCERLCESGQATQCNAVACEDLDDTIDCYYKLGAGNIDQRVDPWAECDIAGDNRYMTAEQDDLGTAFECTAALGTEGSGNEKPMQAMIDALSPDMNGTGGCNAGFLRDDAILVVTVITDEEEKGEMAMQSPGTPQEWHQAVLDAKLGNAGGVVVLGLIGDIGQPGSICKELNQGGNNTDGAEASPRLRAFIEAFGPTQGLEASVCADDYGPFFEEAVALIDTTCKDFDPEG